MLIFCPYSFVGIDLTSGNQAEAFIKQHGQLVVDEAQDLFPVTISVGHDIGECLQVSSSKAFQGIQETHGQQQQLIHVLQPGVRTQLNHFPVICLLDMLVHFFNFPPHPVHSQSFFNDLPKVQVRLTREVAEEVEEPIFPLGTISMAGHHQLGVDDLRMLEWMWMESDRYPLDTAF